MKTNKFLIAAAAVTMLFASCSKEGGNDSNTAEGQKAKLTINISNPTRTAGTAPSGDNTIGSYVAFVCKTNGEISKRVTGNANTATITDVTTDATELYIVANAGTTFGSTFTSRANIIDALANLDDQNASGTGSRWATGSAALTYAQQTDGSYLASPTIVLNFVSARIVLSVNNNTSAKTTSTDATKDLKITGALVYNAGATSKLFPGAVGTSATTLVPSTYSYFAGELMPTTWAHYNSNVTVKGYLADQAAGDAIAQGATKTFYYYIFENGATTASAFPTIVSVTGTYDGATTYFPVHLAAYEQFATGTFGSTILRGKSYNINVNIKGDSSYPAGGGGGVVPPTVPVVTAKVEVTMSIEDWNAVPLSKEFGN